MRKSRRSFSPNEVKSIWVSALLGVGLMAAVDEIVFHQLLGWHHFYDLATPMIGLISDGFLHAAELIAIVAGFFLFSELRKTGSLVPQAAWSGFFLGAGGFQLFDGIVDHKVLRLHQIRYGVNIVPYDIAWNLSALILLGIGLKIASSLRSSRTVQATPFEDQTV